MVSRPAEAFLEREIYNARMRSSVRMYRRYPFELKSLGTGDEIGSFEGYLSIYGNVDSYGDIVAPGAFDASLKEKNGLFPLLWQHDTNVPIGIFKATSDDKGLAVKGQICMDSERGKEAYALLRMKPISPIGGMSIGFNTIADEYDKEDHRILKEIDLWEGSFVTFPANREAIVTEVKEERTRRRVERLVEFVKNEVDEWMR